MASYNAARAFATFFKIGLFTIGGGPVMLPLIEREVVTRNGWLNRDEYLDLLVVSQSAPGVFAANFAIAIGYRLGKVRGALCCLFGTVLPSIVCILAIALFFQRFRQNEVAENVFRGIRPAVTALILGPIFSLTKAARITWRTVWIPIVTALLVWLLGVSPVWVIVAAILGGVARYFSTKKSR